MYSSAQRCTSSLATSARMLRIRLRPGPFVEREGLLECIRDAVDVVGVHLDRIPKVLGGPGELAQHERTVVGQPRRDVLVRHEVHPVTEWRDQGHVSRDVVREERSLIQVPVEIVDRDLARTPEATVHMTDEPIDVGLQVGVGAHVGTARNHDLNERVVVTGRAGPAHELLVGEDPFRDPLRIVESVDAEHDLSITHRRTEGRGVPNHGLVCGDALQLLHGGHRWVPG